MTDTAQPGQRLTNKWVVLALLLAIAIFNYGDRALLPGLERPIKDAFGLSDGTLGLLMGPAFAVLYAAAALPIARLADRKSRIMIVCAGCAVWSVFTVMSGLATNGWTLGIARIGVGIGEAAFQAPAFSLIVAYFPPDQRGKAFGVILISNYLGQMLGYAAGPAIAETYHWRMAFYLMGAAGMSAAMAAWIFIKEPPRDIAVTAQEPLWPLLTRLAKVRAFVLLTLGYTLGVFSGTAFGNWGPALFQRAYDLTPAEAGSMFGAALAFPGIIGGLASGALVDWLAKKGFHRALNFSAVALAVATSLTLAVTWAPSKEVAGFLALGCGLLAGGWAVGCLSGFQHLFPDHIRATATAPVLMLAILFGTSLGPWLTGEISDLFGGDTAYSLRMALSCTIPLGLIGALLIKASIKSLEQDKANLEANQF